MLMKKMLHCKQGVHNFLRAYSHYKSADWPQNKPYPLKGWTADELAKMPRYYIMDLDQGMAETVEPEMPNTNSIANCQWLTESELSYYSESFQSNGFQGSLNWYRCSTLELNSDDFQLFSGLKINVPS